MDIKIEVENAEEEIKLLDEASSLIGRLQLILHELDRGIGGCKALVEAYASPNKSSDKGD